MSRVNILLYLITFIVTYEAPTITRAFRVFDVNGIQTILALENENISIVCKTGMPMAYCGFIHPTGKRFSFSGNSLIDGHCAVDIQANRNDSGDWKCHIGRRTIGVEIKQDIKLRVVNKMAAIEPNITAVHGKDVTLICVTTKEKTPLRYCRFEPPMGIPFSIDSAIKPSEPILGKYYYPQNLSLDRGDCAVTIHKVKYSDVGTWTCGAGLDDEKEHTDRIRLDVEGLYTMSTASSTGITFGAIGIVIGLVILTFIVWKKRRFMGTTDREPETIEVQDLGPQPQTPRTQSPVEFRRSIPSLVVESPSEPGTSPVV